MKIYTSYFGNAKKLASANITIISIARFRPRFLSCVSLLEVAPSAFMVKGDITREQYISLYEDILKKLNIDEFINKISVLSGGRDVALCCYEKPDDFCHRHLLSKWIKEKVGYEITEFGTIPKVKTPPQPVQQNLFD